MLNLEEIENTIEALEHGDTTFSACERLAALYIVRDKLKDDEEPTEKEINDILPSYRHYADTKRKFHAHKLTEDAVVAALQSLCTEIADLMRVLYASTEMIEERREIGRLLGDLYNMYAES
jgi:hypothetical protein